MFRSLPKSDNYPNPIFLSLKKMTIFHCKLKKKTCSFSCSAQTQREGLIFIYDMTNSSYGNFDYELCVKILNLLKVNTFIFFFSPLDLGSLIGFFFFTALFFFFFFAQGAFPARLKCVFIVSSPLWFRAPFAVLRLFVREKLRERVRREFSLEIQMV